MADFHMRYPLNAPGKYYIDDQCTDCDLCRESAPNNIRRDDRTGISYVFKQPENEDEIKAIEEGGVSCCPTEAVGNDGDKFNWNTEPIQDWNARYREYGIHFEISAPILPEKSSKFWWWPFKKR
ncbi:ferredoxin [Oscillatoria amoena NRMC-F 0135]|nr:ferredoxin [Oscillatoria laete-virens]MDL5051066.1 ferredoxin [Oscillatoria amoena NRMC-F 0135]